MRSHFMLGRGLSMACAAVGATALPSALRAAPIASDNASNAAYTDGWQVGDNGGFGFGPWNMTGTENTIVQHSLDSTSPYNQLGLAWTLFNPNGPPPDSQDNPNHPQNDTDISQAGRGILGGLQPGQTFAAVIDNPIERRFYRGYTVRLNTGGGNTTYAGIPQSRLAIGTFDYGTNGRWYASGSGGNPTLFDTDTAAGLRIDVTLETVDTFSLLMTPLDDPSKAYTKSGTLEGETGSQIDWVEFEFYNTDSDFFNKTETGDTVPMLAEFFQSPTDFYIRSVEIAVLPPPAQWNRDGDGSFGVATNWDPNVVPDDPGAVANFLGVITAPRTVTLDGNRMVRAVNFDNAQSYTIAPGSGGGTLTIGELNRPGFLTTDSGSHRITAKVIFAETSSVDLAADSSLALEGGLEIGLFRNLIKSGPGSLLISGPQTHQSGAKLLVKQGRLDLNSNAGAPATSTAAASANLSISMGNEEPAINLGASQNLAGLTIAFNDPGAQGFDLASTPGEFHSLSIHGGDLDSARSSLAAAIHNAKAIPGDGIFDSGLHANSDIGIARLTDAHGDPFLFIRPTRIGDLNLDGSVTISDFIDLASNFNGLGGWQEGDLNGDGQVTISDFIDLSSNFGMSYAGTTVPTTTADLQLLSAFASAHGIAVPEPLNLTLASFAASGLMLRRRRK